MTSWNRSARLSVNIPKQAEIRLKLSSTSRLQFGLGLTPQVECMLETWQDELVATWNNVFAPVRTLTEADKEIALRLTLDSASGQFNVHDWNGQLLAQVSLPQNMNYPGILLKNMGRNLILQHLSVRAWNGQDLVKLPAVEGYAEHIDGSCTPGLLVPSDSATELRIHSTNGDKTLPLTHLRSYQCAAVKPLHKQSQSQLRFSDGAQITGDLLELKEGTVQQRIPGLAEPLSSNLESLVRIVMAEGEWQQQPERTDILQFGQEHKVTGTLQGSAQGQLLWQLQAAEKPVALAPGLRSWEILRKQQSMSTDAPALFFLRDGQVFPGELRGLDEQGVQLATPVTETKLISHHDLNAVHFKTTQSQVGPLGTEGWRFLNEEDQPSKVADGKLTLLAEGRYGHPCALMGDELNFSLNMPESWGAVAVRLFIEDMSSSSSHAAQIHFMQSSHDMWCAVEGPDGGQRQSEQLRNAPPGKITIQMLMDDANIQILANGKQLLNAALSLDQRKGLGIMFGPSSMWGNGQQRRVEITDFSVRSRPEYVPVPHVSTSHKEQALSIPRFRRESPPTHAILAPNGDLLRGRIESISSTGLRFSSGLESLELPFSRLTSAIWLQPPSVKSASQTEAQRIDPFQPSHWVLLNDGSRLALTLDRVMPTELQGWCPSLGDCRINLERVIQLSTQELPPTVAMKAYQNWQLVHASEPVLAETGGLSSPMLGKDAPPYILRLLAGGTASAKSELGKVVVLDFWATWCGPCVKSLPKTVEMMKEFDPSQVHFIAVNQGETDDQVKAFMQAKGLQMSVGMDLTQATGKAFGVEGIPHQVVINRAGKVIWVNTGAGEEEKLLGIIRTALQEAE
jgi:thiol-disulfide isomerase/thioredoxin